MQTLIVNRKYLLLFSLLSLLLFSLMIKPPQIEPTDNSIFVYGTLKYSIVRNVVCLCFSKTSKVTLENFRKEGLNIVPSTGDRVEGKIIYVSDRELHRLDRYENIPINYRREKISIGDDEHFVYLLNQ